MENVSTSTNNPQMLMNIPNCCNEIIKDLMPPISLSPKEQLHVTLTTAPKGQQYVEIRTHCLDSDNTNGTFKPTMKEIRIPIEQFANFTESIRQTNHKIQTSIALTLNKLCQFKNESIPVNP